MARLLHRVQQKGIKTSIDVVSETGDRYRHIVPPALRYTDYCVINELEAQQITGIPLRDADNALLRDHLPQALHALKAMGISTWSVIHCPELGCGIDEHGTYCELPSLQLPQGYIQGTVGAGDAFCSGVLYAAVQGQTLADGLKLGACCAAASLSQPGASDGVGTAAEVLQLWDQYGPL